MADDHNGSPSGEPRTRTVLLTLVSVALVVSWLTAYAGANALVAAELISPWPADHDPRWRWMLGTFLTLVAVLLGVGGLFRWLSQRQLRRIDAMAEDTPE